MTDECEHDFEVRRETDEKVIRICAWCGEIQFCWKKIEGLEDGSSQETLQVYRRIPGRKHGAERD